ncbi:MAG: 3-oxoacyl-ACP reductase FabG [Thermoplasmata archaeon]|nr:3-oxoacyl-ACP reductase FabG [Thermoplasmata archaeon]
MELENKNAIVTGGSLGIGASIAVMLSKEGANVAITYRRHSTEAKEVVKKIESYGRKGLAVQADVASFQDAQKMIKKVLEELGSLEILVCNAGISKDRVVWKMTEDIWDEVMAVNLKGYFNYIHAVSGIFKNQKYGKIINITSITGLRGRFGQSSYSASKGGIVALTKTVARELGRFNVNVNAVAPGLTETEMTSELPEAWRKKAIEETALGRTGKPEDVANVVVFLASDKSRHITGEIIKVDGGEYI